jgi:hypothetical protein
MPRTVAIGDNDQIAKTLRMTLCADFVAKIQNRRVTTFLPEDETSCVRPINMASSSSPKSPVSLSLGDEVPHIFNRKPRLRPRKIVVGCAKRLLQQNLPKADIDLTDIPIYCAGKYLLGARPRTQPHSPDNPEYTPKITVAATTIATRTP